jgi:AmmeMemoRadiSam system protein A
LAPEELADLDIYISVLSPPEPLPVSSESELIDALRPGVDGLVLRDGARQGTFLPSVWESVPEPAEFLRQLKQKTGLPANAWCSSWQVFRYTTESIP